MRRQDDEPSASPVKRRREELSVPRGRGPRPQRPRQGGRGKPQPREEMPEPHHVKREKVEEPGEEQRGPSRSPTRSSAPSSPRIMPTPCWRLRKELTEKGQESADATWDMMQRKDRGWIEEEFMMHVIRGLRREEFRCEQQRQQQVEDRRAAAHRAAQARR